MRTPDVELLWWQGCPSTDKALAELRQALLQAGLDESAIRTREIRSDAEARAACFAGSPTILIDGNDVTPADRDDEPVSLTCRVYRRGDGRIAATPDPEDLRAAIERAANRVVSS